MKYNTPEYEWSTKYIFSTSHHTSVSHIHISRRTSEFPTHIRIFLAKIPRDGPQNPRPKIYLAPCTCYHTSLALLPCRALLSAAPGIYTWYVTHMTSHIHAMYDMAWHGIVYSLCCITTYSAILIVFLCCFVTTELASFYSGKTDQSARCRRV